MITPLLLICFVVGINSFNVTIAADAKAKYIDRLAHWFTNKDDAEYIAQYVSQLIDSENFEFHKCGRFSFDLHCEPTTCDRLKEIFGNAGYEIEETELVTITWQISILKQALGLPLCGTTDFDYTRLPDHFRGYNIALDLIAMIRERKKVCRHDSVEWKGSAEECDDVGKIFKAFGYEVERHKMIVLSW